MDKKTVAISVAGFVIFVCICPWVIALIYMGIQNLDNRNLRDLFGGLFLALVCLGPIFLAVVGAGWQIRHIVRSRRAGERLAQTLGLQPLNEAEHKMAVWYGGDHQGRRFAVKPFGTTYRYYAMERSRTGVRFQLRIAMEVRMVEPGGILVRRKAGRGAQNPQTFDDAFEQQNAAGLSAEARTALLEFVHKGHRTGLSGVSLRFSKGTRNLLLCDRSAMPKGLLAPEILADAPAVLVYDHPDTTVSGEAFRALLDDLAVVAGMVEKST